MLRFSKMSDEEIKELMAKPISKEDADRLHKINEEDRWMLSMFLISEASSEERASGKAKPKRKR